MNTTASEVAGVPASSLSSQSYQFLQNFILRDSGIVIDDDKRYLIESRLLPLLRKEGISSLDSLCGQLAARSSADLCQKVIEAMTTNETLFFRDPVSFEALRTEILPMQLRTLKGRRKMKIWSAAASTGQEAYSVAMLLREAGFSSANVEIVGTDISADVLRRAHEARYLPFEVGRGLSPQFLAKYFTKAGAEWQLCGHVRSMVTFHQLDLRSNLAAMGACDLVLCRNVLIYFNAETKKRVLAELANVLAPSGLLALGSTESVSGMEHVLRRRYMAQSTFYTAARHA